MTASDASGGRDWSETASEIGDLMRLFGEQAAINVVQDMVRGEITRLLQSYGAEDVRNYILVETPIVKEKAPESFHEGLMNVGPNWFEEIQAMVTPGNILTWLETADDWLDESDVERYTDDADKSPEELQRELQEIAEVIRTTPGGMDWLKRECRDIYVLASGRPLGDQTTTADDD